MAKDETEIGITGLPIPKKKRSPKKQHEFEKERRANLGTNIGGQRYSSGAKKYYAESRGGEASPGTPESFHKLSRGKKKEKGVKTSYDTQGNMIRKYATMQLQKRKQAPYSEEVDMYDILISHLLDEGYADTESAAEIMMNHMSEEWVDSIIISEVKGFGGHVDPNTGKSSGLRSSSQQAHTTYWSNRQQGKDVPDPRRSKFKYGGAKGSTTGAHEGDTPEGFARKQDPQLAMTPKKRMEVRAKSLEAKGKAKQANKIRGVMNRPNM
jgi:hypothetical protein